MLHVHTYMHTYCMYYIQLKTLLMGFIVCVQAEAKAALEELCGILPLNFSSPVSMSLVVVVVVVVVVDYITMMVLKRL